MRTKKTHTVYTAALEVNGVHYVGVWWKKKNKEEKNTFFYSGKDIIQAYQVSLLKATEGLSLDNPFVFICSSDQRLVDFFKEAKDEFFHVFPYESACVQWNQHSTPKSPYLKEFILNKLAAYVSETVRTDSE